MIGDLRTHAPAANHSRPVSALATWPDGAAKESSSPGLVSGCGSNVDDDARSGRGSGSESASGSFRVGTQPSEAEGVSTRNDAFSNRARECHLHLLRVNWNLLRSGGLGA